MGEQVAAGLQKRKKEKKNQLGGVAQLGEHLPCKQGVKSSNLSISIGLLGDHHRMYLENRIQKLISRVKDRELIDVC